MISPEGYVLKRRRKTDSNKQLEGFYIFGFQTNGESIQPVLSHEFWFQYDRLPDTVHVRSL